jgi:hypothetical protein
VKILKKAVNFSALNEILVPGVPSFFSQFQREDQKRFSPTVFQKKPIKKTYLPYSHSSGGYPLIK